MLHATYGGYGNGGIASLYRTDGVFKASDRNMTLIYQAQAQALVPSMAIDGIVGPQTLSFSRFFNLKLTDTYSTHRQYCYGANGIICGTYEAGVKMRYYFGFEAWLIDTWGCNGYVIINHPAVPNEWFQNCG